MWRLSTDKKFYSQSIKLNFPSDSRPSRDILYAKGLVNKDTIHLFVNHWPSRYGGQLATAPKRDYAAEVLYSKCIIDAKKPFLSYISILNR